MTPQLMRDCLSQEIKAICGFTHVRPDELFSLDRSARVLRARKALARELAQRGMNKVAIGKVLGRHHTAVTEILGRRKRDKYRGKFRKHGL